MRRLWILGAFVTACGGDGGDAGVAPAPVTVASVAISAPAEATLLVGSGTQLTASARDAQNNPLPAKPIAWSTGNPTVASVNASGLVLGVAPGEAQVRATSDGKFAEVTITVRAQPWTVTGSLVTGRALHTLTALADGRVLAVGGQRVGTPFQTIGSSELYDPAAGSWRAGGNLTTARANHVAVRLTNGKVLIAGGYSIELSSRLSSAELYDPASDSWSVTGSMAEARDLAAAALLPDGRVLVAGGSGAGTNLNALATAEIYDPVSGSWSKTASMSVARGGHTASTLANGKIVVAGGGSGTFATPTLHASAELYDPATGTWTTTGSVSLARGYHRAVALPTGRLLLTGGSDFVTTVFPTTDLYDPATGVWTATAALGTGRISHSATVLRNGNVLVAGGGGASVLGSTELFDVAAGRWAGSGELRVPRSNHAAVLLPDGRVLVAGGQGVGASTSAEVYAP